MVLIKFTVISLYNEVSVQISNLGIHCHKYLDKRPGDVNSEYKANPFPSPPQGMHELQINSLLASTTNTHIKNCNYFDHVTPRLAAIKQLLSVQSEAIKEYKLILDMQQDYVPALKGLF